MEMEPHLSLFQAINSNNIVKTKQVLEAHPDLDINWMNPNYHDETFLHLAAQRKNPEIGKILLAHPLIDVNKKDNGGWTPVAYACDRGNVPLICLLCQDPRVDVNLTANKFGYWSLYNIACNGTLAAAKWLIALRGEDLDSEQKGSYNGEDWTTPLEIARIEGHTEMSSLLERLTQYELRVELGLPGSLASELFAVVVFLCDDLLKIKQDEAHTTAGRFFAIATTLPMELQMLLCHRVMRSNKQNILSKDSELSFKQLAKELSS